MKFYYYLSIFMKIYLTSCVSFSNSHSSLSYPALNLSYFYFQRVFLRWLYHPRVFSPISLQYCHMAHAMKSEYPSPFSIRVPILLNNWCAIPCFIHCLVFYLWSVVKKIQSFHCHCHWRKNRDRYQPKLKPCLHDVRWARGKLPTYPKTRWMRLSFTWGKLNFQLTRFQDKMSWTYPGLSWTHLLPHSSSPDLILPSIHLTPTSTYTM